MDIRWITLILCCGAQCGFFFVYSAPAAIQIPIQQQYNLNFVQYNMLFAVYCIPSIIIPMFAGMLCDKYNTSLCLLAFCVILNIGQIIFSIGFNMHNDHSYIFMLFGRLILGMCGESLTTATGVILGVYFVNKEQSFSYSVCTTISRLFAVLSYPITTAIYETYSSISYSIWFGEYIMLFSLLCSIGMTYIDYNYSNNLEPKTHKNQAQLTESFFDSIKNNINICFILLLILCPLQYTCIYCWIAIGSSFMQSEYKYGNILSNTYLMIPQGISAILTPFFGILVDKIGYRCYLLILASGLLICGHLLFFVKCFQNDHIVYYGKHIDNKNMINDIDAIYGLTALGISFSIFPSILFTAINVVLPDKLKGFGMGLMCAVLAFGGMIYPIIVGSLTETTNSRTNYIYPQLSFLITSMICLVVSIILKWADWKKSGNKLRMKQSQYGLLKLEKSVSYGSIEKKRSVS